VRRFGVAAVSRWVWLINGIILLGVMIVLGVAMLVGWATSGSGDRAAQSDSIDHTDTIRAPRTSIRYDLPEPIEGTATRVVLVREGRGLPSGPLPSAGAYRAAGAVVNVAFMDVDGSVRLLFDREARVFWVSYPGAPEWVSGPLGVEPGQRQIVYAAATRDSNGDGRIDVADDPRLFMSSLEGRGIRAVLPEGLRFEGMRSLRPGLWLITALEGSGASRRERAFLFAVETGELRPYGALDSVAARAGSIVRRR
jgi:hypothetical protein